MAIDVTERMHAEESLRQSEERFRSLVSVITDVPWTVDAQGAFIEPQPIWEAYTGQTWEEHRGFGWANAIHPDDRERVQALWFQARDSRELYQSDGRLWHAPTQQYRHFEARATPLFNPDGTVREWVGACTDVEDRKRAEMELRDADRRKDDFLATLAHELRNPLAPIRNSLHLLKLSTDADAVGRIHDMMERQVTHMVRLVDDLLEISRISRGKIELRVQPTELAAVIRSAVESSRPLIDAARHQLAISLPADPVPLYGDPVRLAQVVANLLNNAAKYTDPGGQIWLAARIADQQVEISVRDTGIGIAREMLARVFDKFMQVDRGRRASQSGLGIGLALVQNLVALHGGAVEVRSAGIGQGSEFLVRLPLAGATRRMDSGVDRAPALKQTARSSAQA